MAAAEYWSAGAAAGLTEDDMRKGLNSDAFRARANDLKDKWCQKIRDRFDEKVGQTQQGLTERWTIHPFVDGCEPPPPGIEPKPASLNCQITSRNGIRNVSAKC